MADYTSVDRIYSKFPSIGSLANLKSADTLTFIDDAEARINSRLINYYTVPVNSSPLLQTVATDAAICLILSQRVFTQERKNRSEWVSDWCRAWDLVDDIASGKQPLVDSSGQLISRRSDIIEVWSNTRDYHPTFDEGDPNNMVVDDDKLEDLEDRKDD